MQLFCLFLFSTLLAVKLEIALGWFCFHNFSYLSGTARDITSLFTQYRPETIFKLSTDRAIPMAW